MKHAYRLRLLKHKEFNIHDFFLAHSKFFIITVCFMEKCEKYFVLSRNGIIHWESISLQLVKTTVKGLVDTLPLLCVRDFFSP